MTRAEDVEQGGIIKIKCVVIGNPGKEHLNEAVSVPVFTVNRLILFSSRFIWQIYPRYQVFHTIQMEESIKNQRRII